MAASVVSTEADYSDEPGNEMFDVNYLLDLLDPSGLGTQQPNYRNRNEAAPSEDMCNSASIPAASTVTARSPPRVSRNRKVHITFTQICQRFNMPLNEAAKALKVGCTSLKERCRDYDIPRWPHRRLKTLEKLIEDIQELGLGNERLENAVQILQEHRQLMGKSPPDELADRTQLLQQRCSRAIYKKRKQMAMESANAAGSEGSTSVMSTTQNF